MKKKLESHIRKLEYYKQGIKPLLQRIIKDIAETRKDEISMDFGDVVDIMSRSITDFDKDSLESITCGTSMALFQEGINTRLNVGESEADIRYCLYFIFSPAKPEDSVPDLDSCDQKWAELAEIPSEERSKEYIKGIKGFIPAIKQIISIEEKRGGYTVDYLSYFIGDIMGKAGYGDEDKFINDNVVSIFCGISPFLFDNGIVTDMVLVSNYNCFGYSFRNVKIGDKRPTLDDCLDKWARLFIEK